mmetsp:Transcript_118040/g.381003  ORF Transcript_118040/g.381003 Transcript_118040/m.381003 type:complete len:319 (-) Transcript_118040:2131-3087(-)
MPRATPALSWPARRKTRRRPSARRLWPPAHDAPAVLGQLPRGPDYLHGLVPEPGDHGVVTRLPHVVAALRVPRGLQRLQRLRPKRGGHVAAAFVLLLEVRHGEAGDAEVVEASRRLRVPHEPSHAHLGRAAVLAQAQAHDTEAGVGRLEVRVEEQRPLPGLLCFAELPLLQVVDAEEVAGVRVRGHGLDGPLEVFGRRRPLGVVARLCNAEIPVDVGKHGVPWLAAQLLYLQLRQLQDVGAPRLVAKAHGASEPCNDEGAELRKVFVSGPEACLGDVVAAEELADHVPKAGVDLVQVVLRHRRSALLGHRDDLAPEVL